MIIDIKPAKIEVSAAAHGATINFDNPVIRILPDPYEGPYDVAPAVEAQVLLTAGKTMESNVIVAPIPPEYADVSETTAEAADVQAGKLFVTAEGILTEGTASGATLIAKEITDNGAYAAAGDGADGYSAVMVNVPQGIVVPAGMALYNGYLLPKIPYADGYNYAWIRRNEQTGNWDLILGTAQWRTRSNASLDSWALEFATQAADGARQYSIPIVGDSTSAADWGEYTSSTNYYGTTNNRKVVWASHDIMIQSTANIMYRHGIAVE